MKKASIFALALVLAVVTCAYAGSYTVTTSAALDARIAKSRTISNTRGLDGSPFTTDQNFVDYHCKHYLRELTREIADNSDDAAFEVAWDAANTATKNSICATLGLAADCKP